MKNSGLLYLLLFYETFAYAQDTLLWKFSTGSAIHSSSTIDENYVYFGSGDMNLYSLNKNLKQKAKLILHHLYIKIKYLLIPLMEIYILLIKKQVIYYGSLKQKGNKIMICGITFFHHL